ncbi:MAG: TIGR01777 family protein [Planctomycetota bacterium]|nr:MAG: TIGR01777 family protein [Planctomycetota bacterium]REK21959.1 MAG: TIGR01777 family protein [Planctomycetota bacterium]REK32191.1 MAG: TIGR01777 family protein [Planctomycetota bacterium]
MQRSKLVIPGGSGFLGRLLAEWFNRKNWEVVVLSRRPTPEMPHARCVRWDGRSTGPWRRELDGADVVINLAGRSVDCRYHARNRRAMMDSRIDSTRVLGEAISGCENPPAVWMNSSTATIYPHSIDRPMDETVTEFTPTPAAKDAFSIKIATNWERTFNDASTPSTRKVALRTAMVLADVPGTVYAVLRRLVRCGLGGRMGSGRQYVSWIHAVDFCRAVEWLIDHHQLTGPVNLAAPHPLPNREMMRVLRKTFGVPLGLPASRWMLEVGAFLLRTETELILKSRRVVPTRLLDSGFEFRFPAFHDAVRNLAALGASNRDNHQPRSSSSM